MNKNLDQALEKIKQKKIGLMTHVVAGFPSLKESEELVMMMASAGVDLVEIQIPFSDPIADGPTIMEANETALKQGTTLQDVFDLVRRLTKQVTVPILLMGYFNSVFHYGVEQFCIQAKAAGVAGLIIPDMPIDEERSEQFFHFCRKHGLVAVRVLSPTSTPVRIQANTQSATGFMYCTAVAGTTGSRHQLDSGTKKFLERVHQATTLPLAVGFGISKPEQIKSLIGQAEIAVVGSATLEVLAAEGISGLVKFLKKLTAVLI